MSRFPDWRNASAYPNQDSFLEMEALADDPLYTSKSWAWQFLRRNGDYQRDCDAWFRHRQQTDSSAIANKYGLTMLVPYEMEFPPAIPFINTLSLRSVEQELRLGKKLNLKEFQVALVFDIRFPLEDQITLAKLQIAEKIQRHPSLQSMTDNATQRRKRARVHSRYLRVIDARNSGASFNEIAQQFAAETPRLYHPNEANGYSCEDRAIQDHNRASKWVEHKYRELAYS